MKKISEKEIRDAIIKESLSIQKKKGLYEEFKKIVNEIDLLNEADAIGSFGFKTENDVMNTKGVTGFAEVKEPKKHISQTLCDFEEEMEEINKNKKSSKEEIKQKISELQDELKKMQDEEKK